MNTLLPLIKQELETLPQLARKSDCYITPHVNFIPDGTAFPCLGMTDGGTVREETSGGMLDLKMTVQLVGFMQMSATGKDVLCTDDGLFAMMNAAAARLVDNRLGLAGFQAVSLGNDLPSEMFTTENKQSIVKLVRPIIYQIQRPETEG